MSWRTFRPAFMQRRPLSGAGIVNESIRAAADEYAAGLNEGDEIVEETDGATIGPFRRLLPQVLARRGLGLGPTSRGWVVERSPFPPLPMRPAECTICYQSFFECGHGIGLEIVINWGPR